MNKAILLGRLTRDPELRYTANGIAVTRFDLAVNSGRKKPDGTSEADFIPVIAWRERAEFVANYLTKGQQILIEGRIKTRTYEDKDGNHRKVTEVEAALIFFADSKRGTNTEPSGEYDTNDFTPVDYDDDLPF